MFNQRGLSLVQVLVLIASLGIMMAVMAAFFVRSASLELGLSQKLEILAFQQLLKQTYANPDNCTCLLNPQFNTGNELPLSFNPGADDPTIQLTKLTGGCDSAKRPTFPLGSLGQEAFGTQTGLKMKRILFTKIAAVSGGDPTQFQGQFEVEFDVGDGLERKSIVLPQRVVINSASPPSARTILRCGDAVPPPPPPTPGPAPTPTPTPPPSPECWSAVFTSHHCGNWVYDTYMAGGCPWATCDGPHNVGEVCTGAGNAMISATCSGACCDFLHQNCSPASCP